MQKTSNVLQQYEDQILTITINRPKALNALNGPTIVELGDIISNLKEDYPNCKGVILTGAGEKAFVAGADISKFPELDDEGGRLVSKLGGDIFKQFEQAPVPVIAAVNGFCLGGGCELAMACHIRVASKNAKFGQPEVNLGLVPGYGGTQRLIQYIGKGKAIELLMTGDMIGAEDAYRLGLANHVVEQEELLDFCKNLVIKISKKGPIAISKIVGCVNAYFDKDTDGFEFENKMFGYTMGTKDAKEGANAFLEKRKPNFKGE